MYHRLDMALKNSKGRARDMAQWLSVLADLPEDLSSVPSSHVGRLTIDYDF